MELELKYRGETLNQPNDLVKDYINSLPDGGVFYDLGSCVGTYALMACKKGMVVYAVEVDEANFNALVENYHHNIGKGVFPEGHSLTVSNVGVADRKGEIDLIIGQPEIGGHQKTLDLDDFCGFPREFIGEPKIRKVQIDTLDNLVEENKIPLPDYIKIDIDGAEYAFLKGASHCLIHAKSLIIELYDKDPRFDSIVETIKSYGFKWEKRGIDLEPHLYDIIFTK
jgi:FkbM family methyltransferase